MAKKDDQSKSLQEGDEATKYPKGESAVFKQKALNNILDSIGLYETESRAIETYRKMKDDDSQVASSFEVLRIAVLAKGYEINYHGKDRELGQEMIDFLTKMFSEINTCLEYRGGFAFAQRGLMDAIWSGFSPIEVVYYYNEELQKVMVKKLKPIPPDIVDFQTDSKGNLTGIYQEDYDDPNARSQYNEPRGNKIPIERTLLWTYRREGSSLKGRSDFDPIYKYWYLKDFILKFWSIFTERYGAPFMFGVTKKKRMTEFKNALKNIITRTELVGVMGEDDVKVLETSHDGNQFENFIHYCDTQITKGMLVPNLLLDSGKSGARSLGDTQFGLFEWRIHSLQSEMEDIWNELIRWVTDLNWKGVDAYCTFNYKPLSDLDRRLLAQTFDLLIKNNVVHPVESWVRELLKLPEADPETIEALKTAWENKVQGISSFSPEAGITPWGGDNRGQAPTQSNLSKRLEGRNNTYLAQDTKLVSKLESFMTKTETKLAKKLEKPVNKLIEGYVEEVERQLQLSEGEGEELELQEHPVWIDNLSPIANPELEVIFTDWYDNALYDSVAFTENELVSIGMEPSWTARTKTGRIKWIEENLAGLREGGQTMATYGANKIPIQMYEFVQPLLIEAYQEGLRGRDLVTKLQETLGNHYSRAYLRNVARTNMTASINSARLSLYRRRSDFVKGVEFMAVLDERTTDICEQLDGRTFAVGGAEIEQFTPPLHYQCRSVLSPITTLDIPEGEDFEPTYQPDQITASVQEGFGGVLNALG